MATTGLHPSPVPTPNGGSSSSNPPTPPTQYPQFPRLPHASSSSPSIQRNASTSSSRSTTTTSSTSSVMAAPMRPPPIETRTAATTPIQTGEEDSAGSRAGSGSESRRTDRFYHSPQPVYGGRGFMRNGPRTGGMARQSTSPVPPIQTSTPDPSSPLAKGSSPLQGKSTTLPLPQLSPTTPRAPQSPWVAQQQSAEPETRSPDDPPMVYVTASGPSSPSSPRGRGGLHSLPSSPRVQTSKPRTLSVDARTERDAERERRMSQASSASSSGNRKPSARDWIFGEELGRGSYSTVVQARPVSLASAHVRHDREYAVKIMNQQHLIAEKKAKYAVIERDALIRLAQPRGTSVSPSTATRHKRGASGSSGRRRSNASMSGSAEKPAGKERLSIAISDSSSITSGPLSPTLLSGRRPSRSAEPPAMVPENAEEDKAPRSPKITTRSRPPSPVKEESSSQGHGDEHEQAEQPAPTRPSTERASSSHRERVSPASTNSPADAMAIKATPTPKKRRTSLAPSERSVKTVSGSKSSGQAHPGIIKLYSTFNDHMSLYYVLELASHGELLNLIRQHGSFDIESARYYAAQLIDTVEFMHEREVIHRDLKPENILLDSEWRIKITDFGSAKILGRDKDAESTETKKRSFVGSADFVSPEVLRNEPAVLASDIWAFGCIVFQLFTGKPPFRGATDYLTFQKILKRDFEYPADFDEEAQALIDLVLNLDPDERPSPAEIKAHSFFSTVDFATLWSTPAPTITTGLTRPIDTLASAKSNSDVWAVFDDDVSDGGFEYDDAENVAPDRQQEGTYDGDAADDAVRHAAHSNDPHEFAEPRYAFQDAGSEGDSDLQPPRPSFVDASPKGKWGRGRLGSHGSERTSSSSSTNRNALSGLLESLKVQGSPFHNNGPASKGGSSRNSRTSERSTEVNLMQQSGHSDRPSSRATNDGGSTDYARWSSLLLANERILHTSTILVRAPTSIHLPSFLLPSPKRRQLILTDFPRLITVKEEASPAGMSVKSECVFVAKGSARRNASGETRSRVEDGTAGWVMDVQEKGPKGFTVQTTTQILNYMTDSLDVQKGWMAVLKRYLE